MCAKKVNSDGKEKKTAADVVIDQFLRDVESSGSMPWQNPAGMFNAFNYFTMRPYSGFNRLMLPSGEYMTKKQIDEYNEEHDEDYRFQKGIKWYPITFVSSTEKTVHFTDLVKIFPNLTMSCPVGYIGQEKGVSYHRKQDMSFVARRGVLKYFKVTERRFLKNSKGKMLPSRFETGEARITNSDPQMVIDNYLGMEKIPFIQSSDGVSCYTYDTDTIEVGSKKPTGNEWYCNVFRDLVHSTGHEKRLKRDGIIKPDITYGSDEYAVEECIAEIAASILCNECAIMEFDTVQNSMYADNVEYVRVWKERITDWGKSFIYIVSQADKAFNYVMLQRD